MLFEYLNPISITYDPEPPLTTATAALAGL